MKNRKPIFNFLIFLILILILFNPLWSNSIKTNVKIDSEYSLYEITIKSSKSSGKIIISNNWSDAKDAGICTGSGNYTDPYLIEDLVIDGGGSGVGILISSKKDYFKIENCTIFNCTYGIKLARSCNGTLVNNNCSNNEIGIYLDGWTDDPHFTYEQMLTFYCMNNTVINNNVNNNLDYGIYCRGGPGVKFLENNTIKENFINNNRFGIYFLPFCINNTILGNTLINNEESGIFILNGPGYNNTFMGNLMRGCGFYSHYSYFLSNKIDNSNLVNNGHLYFYANSTGLNGNDFSNAGQIILVNCNNSIITKMDLSDGSVSISLIECNNMEISNSNLSSNSMWGLELSNCNKILIRGNLINENHEGIHISGSHHNKISRNSVNKNYWEGIYLADSTNNSIIENEVHENLWGIRNWLDCHNNTIKGNNVSHNLIGIEVRTSDCLISENIINDNSNGIDVIGNHLNISQNLVYNNKDSGISIGGNYNIVLDNIIRNNSKNGLSLYNALNNEIYNNIIKDNNQTGVYIKGPSCENNSFYINFFIGNSNHVFDNGTNDKWNNTDIGNYWDNYTGTDIDGDGIGNIPYNISIIPLIQDFLPIVDNDIPNIIIHSPQSNENFGKNPPSLIISVEEKYLDLVWYTLDDGLNNYTFISNGTIDQEAWKMAGEGPIVIKVYAMDKTGKIGEADVIIIKKASEKELISGYNLQILIFLNVVILILLIFKKLKNVRKKE